MRLLQLKLLTLVCLLGSAVPAAAQDIALTFTGGVQLGDEPTIGWRFTTTAPILVTELGFFDADGDGLIGSHQVAIWNTSGGPAIVTGTVPDGTAGTLVNDFRFTPVAPTVLPAGDYVVGGDKPSGTGGDFHMSDVAAGDVVLGSGISYVENRYIFDDADFLMPTETFGPQELGYFGANFRFTAAAVPEPATVTLLFASGLAALAYRSRKRWWRLGGER